jgi:DNA-directed RNA polymerase subunit RPC12/RpoP
MTRFTCSFCGASYDVESDLAGKLVKCRECGERGRVPARRLAQYEYRMVPIPPNVVKKDGMSMREAAADYLQTTVNEQAQDGWDFFRVDAIGVRVPQGCMAALLGDQERRATYYVVTFRRESSA